MDKILFVDSCIRKDKSRTLILAKALLNKLNGDVECLDINTDRPLPLTEETLALRDKLSQESKFDDSFFRYANQFANADIIVIAAPYWDMSFPAVLKSYIEQVSVCGITFHYTNEGIPEGLCKCKKLYYVTTAGGYTENMNFGYDYIKGMCNIYYGIKDVEFISAEGLDIWGNDPKKILSDAINNI